MAWRRKHMTRLGLLTLAFATLVSTSGVALAGNLPPTVQGLVADAARLLPVPVPIPYPSAVPAPGSVQTAGLGTAVEYAESTRSGGAAEDLEVEPTESSTGKTPAPTNAGEESSGEPISEWSGNRDGEGWQGRDHTDAGDRGDANWSRDRDDKRSWDRDNEWSWDRESEEDQRIDEQEPSDDEPQWSDEQQDRSSDQHEDDRDTEDRDESHQDGRGDRDRG